MNEKTAARKRARNAKLTTKIHPGMTDRSRLHPKANESLDANLAPGEAVRVIITGVSDQAIIGTDHRVFVYKKGFMAGAAFGSEMTSFDYRNLVGVQLHVGMMSGAVILQGAGMSGQSTSIWDDSDNNPHRSPNAIPIVKPFNQAQEGVAKLRELIERAHWEPSSKDRTSALPPVSIVDELKKLADLRDAGVISDSEFAGLKRGMLAKAQP